jgi:hypothetical protein
LGLQRHKWNHQLRFWFGQIELLGCNQVTHERIQTSQGRKSLEQ